MGNDSVDLTASVEGSVGRTDDAPASAAARRRLQAGNGAARSNGSTNGRLERVQMARQAEALRERRKLDDVAEAIRREMVYQRIFLLTRLQICFCIILYLLPRRNSGSVSTLSTCLHFVFFLVAFPIVCSHFFHALTNGLPCSVLHYNSSRGR
jgi:hypothetical protein